MRHQLSGRQLSRNSSHRKALMQLVEADAVLTSAPPEKPDPKKASKKADKKAAKEAAPKSAPKKKAAKAEAEPKRRRKAAA